MFNPNFIVEEMNTYILNGHCQKNQEDTLIGLEKMINDHGTIVAYNKQSDVSLTLMAEISEIHLENLMGNLEKLMSVKDLKLEEAQPEKKCNVLLNLSFRN